MNDLLVVVELGLREPLVARTTSLPKQRIKRTNFSNHCDPEQPKKIINFNSAI